MNSATSRKVDIVMLTITMVIVAAYALKSLHELAFTDDKTTASIELAISSLVFAGMTVTMKFLLRLHAEKSHIRKES